MEWGFSMNYIARFKDGKKHYRVLCTYQAIGTIDESTFNKYRSLGKVQANQYIKTLVISDYDDYKLIRNSYKSNNINILDRDTKIINEGTPFEKVITV
jgi:hypothetical protein